MEFKLYENKQELIQDATCNDVVSKLSLYQADVAKYNAPSTQTYVVKFTDGDKRLFVLRIASLQTLILGSASLAANAADVIADYHLAVGNCVGDKNAVDVFTAAYFKRLGDTIRQALFAGGCFWCMAKPYYEYDGVKRVFSGYAGGSVVNPTYEQVKTGTTLHKETVLLEYDSAVISFKQLLDIYFDTIDPFDEYGQFIDRGDNYTCAIFTDDAQERAIISTYISDIEKQFNRKVQVKILGSQVFYKAEEYHQDYALKNPEAMQEELQSSGRLTHSPLKDTLK